MDSGGQEGGAGSGRGEPRRRSWAELRAGIKGKGNGVGSGGVEAYERNWEAGGGMRGRVERWIGPAGGRGR